MFERFNLNPKGIKAGDCVVRAIAYATQQSWNDVYKALCDIGFKMKRLPDEKAVWSKYLDTLGWVKHKQPRKWDNTKYTVDEFCKEFPKNDYIISVANHLTTVNSDRDIIDTWNCGRKSIGNYWTRGDVK